MNQPRRVGINKESPTACKPLLPGPAFEEQNNEQNFGGRSDQGPVLAEDATYAPAPTDKA